MNKQRCTLTAFVIAAMLSAAGCASHPRMDVDDLTRLSLDAADEDRLLIVYATAEWCGPCQAMKRDTWADEPVRQWLDANARKITLDVDRQPELAVEQLNARTIPQTIVFKDGREFDRLVGYQRTEELMEWLGAIERGERRVDILRKRYEENLARGIEDAGLVFRLAVELVRIEAWDEATEHLAMLWRHRAHPDLSDFERINIPYYMGIVAERDEPSRKVVLALRDEISKTRPDNEYDALDDWLRLSAVALDHEAIITWFESLDDLARHERLLQRFASRMFWLFNAPLTEAIIEGNRWHLLARLWGHQGERWTGEADAATYVLAIIDDYARLKRRLGRSSHEEIHQAMRYEGAAGHVLMLTQGREDDARAITSRLLYHLNDAETRMAIVERAVRAGVVTEQHAALLWEAERRGVDRPDLREQVENALQQMHAGQ